MEAFLTADQMRQALQAGAPALEPPLTPEQMHEQFHAANGGLGHAEVAAMQPTPPDLAPPLATPDAQAAPDASAMPQGDPISALAVNNIAQSSIDADATKAKIARNVDKMDAGFAAENKANDELRQLKSAEAEAQAPIEAEKTRLAKANEDAMAAIAQKGQIAAQRQMVRLNAAADAASTAEVHDFWQDRSTGARILGILSQAFAGAANGLANNPGAVTPLDRVIQDDLQKQQVNLNQKNKAVGEARGVLNDIYQQTGSQQQAQAAMYVAAWKRVEQQANEVKNKFGTPEAQQQFDAVSALAQQRQASAKDKILDNMYNAHVQNEQYNLKLLQEQQGARAAADKPLTGENERIFTLAGTTGEVDNRTYEKFKDADQNFRGITAQQKAIKHIFKGLQDGHLGEVEAYKQYAVARSDLLSFVRKQQGTGAALSDQELANVERMLPDFRSASAPGFRDFMHSDGISQMDRIMDTTGRHYFSQVNKTLKGVTLNPNDPDYGTHIKRYLSELAAQQAEQ